VVPLALILNVLATAFLVLTTFGRRIIKNHCLHAKHLNLISVRHIKRHIVFFFFRLIIYIAQNAAVSAALPVGRVSTMSSGMVKLILSSIISSKAISATVEIVKSVTQHFK